MVLTVGQIVGQRYRLDAMIARGGMGAVYRATDTRLDRTVAIKVLLAELASETTELARFEREAHAIARVVHPCIVQMLDVGREDDTEYLVMEHVQGRTLAHILGKDGKLDPARAADVTEQALFAIAAAHAAGIVHRDLKPGNVMLVPTGGREVVKVLDFGIAQLKTGTAYTRLTATGAILGTPAFMAPEQARGQPTDERTDVYAMGVLLWCMLTGKKPFVGTSPADTIGKLLAEVPTRADRVEPSAPAALAHVAEVAMQKDPAARFASAQAFANALVALRQAPPISHAKTTSDRGQMATLLTGDGTVVPHELIGAPRLSAPPAPLPPTPIAALPMPAPSTFAAPPSSTQRTVTNRQLVVGGLIIAGGAGLLSCLVFALVMSRCATPAGHNAGAPMMPIATGQSGGSACARLERCCQLAALPSYDCSVILRGPEYNEQTCSALYPNWAATAQARGRHCE